MDIEQMLKLINAVSESELTEFHYEEGELHLKLSKKNKQIITATETPVKTVLTEQEAKKPVYEGKEVLAPLVGTFYHASSPENPPYVKVGDTVKKGQILGIIEAMKLMNEIESECDGVVQAVLVENEELVEYGQPLFIIG